MTDRQAVAIVYPYVPHYRRPVFAALARHSGRFSYAIFAGANVIDQSIRSGGGGADFAVQATPLWRCGNLVVQTGLAQAIAGSRFQHFIFLGDPHIISTWCQALLAKCCGKRVYFWTHGWLRRERGIKGLLRRTYYRLADGLLLYGDRARNIGIELGFCPSRLFVIYNSLDYEQQRQVRESIMADDYRGREFLPAALRQRKIYACSVARLTSKCRFDLAIAAVALANSRMATPMSLVLIGDGPVRPRLAAQARALDVDLVLVGETYDEHLIGAVLLGARLVISPGKVGLTAMHSLAYGVPVLTHGNLDQQMPEAEAIVPGVTGDFFRQNNVEDMAALLIKWLEKPQTLAERAACIALVEARYTPQRQVEFIEAAMTHSDT